MALGSYHDFIIGLCDLSQISTTFYFLMYKVEGLEWVTSKVSFSSKIL